MLRPTLLLSITLLALPTGCDKLKAVAGGGEGGAPIVGDLFGSDFEGEITLKMTTATQPGKAQRIVVGIKKPKYRMDMSEDVASAPLLGSVILDAPTKKGWMLVHQGKMAMPIDLTKPPPQMPNLPGLKNTPPAPTTPPKVEKTGKKDSVAGYSCEIWNVTSDNRRSEVCMAENLTWIDMSDMGMQGPEVALSAVATGGNHFPLRVIGHDASGKEDVRMEAQKVDKKSLDDTRFVPPADYRQFDPSKMPQLPVMPPIPSPKAR